jgi:hypothetical protein
MVMTVASFDAQLALSGFGLGFHPDETMSKQV